MIERVRRATGIDRTSAAGIATMQTLATFVDGHVDIDSAPGRGTCIRAVLGAPAVMPPAVRLHLQLVTDPT